MDHFDQERAELKLRGILEAIDNAEGSKLAVLYQNVLTARFDEGFQLAASIEQRAAEEHLRQYVLDVLGKDRGDGPIDLGALGSNIYHETREQLRCSKCGDTQDGHGATVPFEL